MTAIEMFMPGSDRTLSVVIEFNFSSNDDMDTVLTKRHNTQFPEHHSYDF